MHSDYNLRTLTVIDPSNGEHITLEGDTLVSQSHKGAIVTVKRYVNECHWSQGDSIWVYSASAWSPYTVQGAPTNRVG